LSLIGCHKHARRFVVGLKIILESQKIFSYPDKGQEKIVLDILTKIESMVKKISLEMIGF
jgi:hypothetical protein